MNTIFVSIASYRDPELPKTVKNLLLNAEFPELLKIVVYEQNNMDDPNDKNNASVYGLYPAKYVTVIRESYKNAKGPNYARAVIQKYYNGEKYYLQIDSHMRTVLHWDTKLIKMLKILPTPAVLTQYPPEYSLETGEFDPNTLRSGLYIQGFGHIDKFTRIQSDIVEKRYKQFGFIKQHYPFVSRAWAACFSFSEGTIVKDAPYDIEYEHLFFGEELDITLKLYTQGYYLFSPHISIFYTTFNRTYRSTHWADIPLNIRENAELKSRYLLHSRIKSGLTYGSVRSVQDYMRFAQIKNFSKCTMEPDAKTFRRLQPLCKKKLIIRT